MPVGEEGEEGKSMDILLGGRGHPALGPCHEGFKGWGFRGGLSGIIISFSGALFQGCSLL